MTTLTADVTEGIRNLVKELVSNGMYKSQSEVVRDAIRQLALKYEIKNVSLNEVRKITLKGNRKSGETLTKAVKMMREEA